VHDFPQPVGTAAKIRHRDEYYPHTGEFVDEGQIVAKSVKPRGVMSID